MQRSAIVRCADFLFVYYCLVKYNVILLNMKTEVWKTIEEAMNYVKTLCDAGYQPVRIDSKTSVSALGLWLYCEFV